MTNNGNNQPDRIDEIMNLLVGFIDETRQFMAEQKQFNAEVTEDISRLTRQVGQLTGDVNRLTDDVSRLTGDVGQLTDDVSQLKRLTDDVGRLTDDVSQLKRLTDDVGQLKGFHVRAVAMQRTGSIARDLDLAEFHVLTHNETRILADRLGGLLDFDMEENERLSFAAADLIIEAHGEGRTKHYIAAEISYTANRDDVRRAVRNAMYLRLLTESDCHAVVVGCEKTPDVDAAVADGSIIWHLISNRAMAPV